MIIGNMHVTMSVIEGVPYMHARAVDGLAPEKLERACVQAGYKEPEMDLVTKINCVTMSYTTSIKEAAEHFHCSPKRVSELVKLFEKDELK